MQFCTNCGTQLPDGSKFCNICGATAYPTQGGSTPPQYDRQPQNNYVPPQNDYVPPQPTYQAPPQPQYGGTQQNTTAPIPEPNSTPDPNDVAANKTNAVLAYLGILFLIPFFSKQAKASPFARFHTAQGATLFIFTFGISAIFNLIASEALGVAAIVFAVISLIFQIIGIVNAVQGTLKPLPLIGKLAVMMFRNVK